MEVILNDIAVKDKFSSIAVFIVAFETVMKLREIARQNDREVKCTRGLLHEQIVSSNMFIEIIQNIDINKRRAIISWLGSSGPFWEDCRQHTSDSYLECNNNVVTDTAVGEAAFSCLNGTVHSLISPVPSAWVTPSLTVKLLDTTDKLIDVQNFIDEQHFLKSILSSQSVVQSWGQLEVECRKLFRNIIISANCFNPLEGVPFCQSASNRIKVLFDVLNKLQNCYDEHGMRTEEGHTIIRNYFTGDKSLFSDSSDSEKSYFKSELTFNDPANTKKKLFCPYHGKVKTPQLRIHFTWPISAKNFLSIVYVGPKITKC